MSRIGRALAAVLLLTFALALPAAPAAAADPALGTHLGQLTLAPGGAEKTTLLWLRIATPSDAEHHFAVAIDYGGVAGFATVDLALAYGASAAVARATDPGPIQSSSPAGGDACEHAGTTITCAWDWYFPEVELVLPIGIVSATPAATAAGGEEGTVTVTSKLDDGASATSTATIRVGTAVDVAADAGGEVDATPGGSAPLAPSVSNAGTTAVDGVVLAVAGPSALLGRTSYQNCRYGDDLVLCTFDTSIAAGTTYTLAQPFTLTPPADSIPGSVGEYGAQWLTTSEFEDFLDVFPDDSEEFVGKPGTGAALGLTPSAAGQGPPQSDVNSKNDAAAYLLTVDGGAAPDFAAIGVRKSAAVGSEVDLAVGMRNRGPGTLHPELYANNELTTLVRLPANVMATGVDPQCGEAGYDESAYTCTLVHTLPAGARDTFDFAVRLEARHGEAGAVQVSDALAEGSTAVGTRAANAANDTAPVVVTATGSDPTLPITGPRVVGIGATGLTLTVIGLLLTVRRGYRRVGAHAEGQTGRTARREGSAR